MKTFKKILAAVLAVVMLLSMAACKKQDADTNTDHEGGNGSVGTYNVSVQTAGGMAMSGIDVYIYADSTLADLKQFKKTDDAGKVSFDMPQSSNYAVVLSGVPKGYDVKDSYSFSGNTAEITLTSSLIQGENLAETTLGLGDVMYDFTVKTPDGKDITLSQVLSEKKMALLNFWYTGCSWCVTEFPVMEEAYQQYKDQIEVIGLNPWGADNDAAVGSFQSAYGLSLSFPLAKCPTAWANTFEIAGYPTSVIVDRYGVICLIESGAITSLSPFVSTFEHFTAENYQQRLFANGVADLVTAVKPTYTMESSDKISALINKGDIQVTYRPETEGEDAEYAWPFIATQKDGTNCLKASNQQIEGSYAILYADVTLKAGQAIGFDYLRSTEVANDVLHVIVNDQAIYSISGENTSKSWESCYPWVALEDGTYELALCYIKDDANNVGDDTVYIKDMRVVDASAINVESFIPRTAATTKDGFKYDYVDIVYNKNDGYYHVGTANGPLLLADLQGYTLFNEEKTVWDLAYDGAAKELYDGMLDYFSYASNSNLNGVCTVTKELAEYLKQVDKLAGFDSEDDNEWLRICKYYQVYGSKNQLEDPIKGLSVNSAFKATLGKNVASNYFYYNRIIMPRGMLAKFVPNKSGVYRITSRSETQQGTEAWIFDENRNELLVYEMDERMYNDDKNVSMVFYMEKGKSYYIDIAFWDVYETGYIYYDIEYIGATYELFRLCSPGYFTYDTNATGDAMYHLIAGGIKVVMGTDGYYHEDLGKDAKGKQRYGSIIYADFSGITTLFDTPVATTTVNGKKVLGMIDKGGFDFSKTEGDLYILGFLKKNNGDKDKAIAEMKQMWGEEYDAYAEIYMIDDVLAGRYHGEGKDMTAEIQKYVSKMAKSPEERKGCVPVDAKLAEILQLLMSKYTFENVDDAWIKMCYYYDKLGPNG